MDLFYTRTALFLVAVLSCGNANDCTECCECAPSDVNIQCVISGESCVLENDDGVCVNRDCYVTAGEKLLISCNNSTEQLILYRENSTHELFGSMLSSEFAESSLSGNYECRWRNNGSVYAVRSIIVILGKYYVNDYQSCCL